MNRQIGKRPEHEMIYSRIKELVLFGEFAPNQALTIHGLAESIDAGITPVREAIRRLIAEGALNRLENRRVEVPGMTLGRLEQIALVRLTVEPELARQAAENCDAATIAELSRLDGLVDQAIQMGDIRGYQETNFRFHFVLYERARAEILLRIAESLWLQIGPSLRVVGGRYGTSTLRDLHQEAIEALRAGDAEAVAHAVRGDIEQGINFVRQTLISAG